MTRRKSRRRSGRLADMSIAPPDPPRYGPPPHDAEYDRPYDPRPDVRLHRVQRYCRNRLVGFAVTLNQRTDTGWQHVVRIDTAHGEVHMHRYLRNGDEERTVFEVIT